jgi:Tol biopolymer transport system component
VPPRVLFSADSAANPAGTLDLLLFENDTESVVSQSSSTDFFAGGWCGAGLDRALVEAVVDSNWALALTASDGSSSTPVSNQPAGDNRLAACSPDGAWIAFVNTNGGIQSLYAIQPDGAN